MAAVLPSSPGRQGLLGSAGSGWAWLRAQRHTLAMAGLLSLAAPLIYFAGALGVMPAPTPAQVAALALWWLLYALLFGGLMLLCGHALQRLPPHVGRGTVFGAALLGSAMAAALVTLATGGRAAILVEQGVVVNATTMHLYAFTLSLTLGLLFQLHLRRSAAHAAATARRARVQLAQRELERQLLQARLQAIQARIDPQLLFEMLDAVRQGYTCDAARAELLLDELIGFLRAALPRLQTPSSSVPREADLARACVRLRALAGGADFALAVSVAADMRHARCPPGVLLPLLDDVLRRAPGPCSLAVTRDGDQSQLRLVLPAPPSADAVDAVRALLADVYGDAAQLRLDDTQVNLSLPHELA